jgi:DNA helicase-2/ATP-dependent DNA helicase PcrA
MHTLNPPQLEGVRHRDGPLLILAGAGSGKTKVVTTRIVELIHEGIEPGSILALTFTNKAAQEMRERVFQQTHAQVLISTFHSFGAKFLREFIPALGLSTRFTIYDEEDSYKVIRAVLVELGIKEKKGDVRIIKNLISQAKNELKEAERLETKDIEGDFLNQFERIFQNYQQKLKEADSLDFDDLLYLPLKILREFPEILERVQNRYKYLMVDEYQDTNQAQYELLKLLSSKELNIFVVGDPDQSIYSWRGANIQNILQFEKDFPGAKVIRLEQNYRSTETILEAANALISNNISRYEKNLWSNLGEGDKISLFVAYTEREEAAFVARKIEKLLDQGVDASEIVIFYRTNAQSRSFEDQLISRLITYRIVGGLSFYQRKEVKDILAFLKVMNQPNDFVAFSLTINLPKRGIGEVTLDKILKSAKLEGLSLLSYVDALVNGAPLKNITKISAKGMEGLSDYVSNISKLKQELNEIPFPDFIQRVIEQTHYLSYLKEEEPDTFRDRKENLDELVAKAAEYSEITDPLSAFLEELTLKSDEDTKGDFSSAITLMTLHNSKGLEFREAFMVGMEEDLFPHANSKSDPNQIEEERRLCYVGMTRAKVHLYLSCCQLRFLFGSEKFMRPSRFLKEIPSEFIKKIGFA